jgi:hypothetical protein
MSERINRNGNGKKKSSNGNGENSSTVTIALRMPNNLVAKLYRFEETQENSPNGLRTIKVAREIEGSMKILNGWNATHFPNNPKTGRPKMNVPCIDGGQCGLTHGVDREWWTEYKKQNHDSPLIVNGFLFAHGSDIDGMVREREDERSGLEPLVPTVFGKAGELISHDVRTRAMGMPVTPYQKDGNG